MKNLTVPVAVPNVTKWALLHWNDEDGTGIAVFFYGAGQSRSDSFQIVVSDAANGSNGVGVNPAPSGAGDTISRLNGVGAASALTHAQAAYAGAGTHAQKVSAVETSLQADGIIAAALVGT